MLLDPGPVKLSLEDDGLVVEVGLRVAPSELKVADALTAFCAPTVAIDGAQLSLHVTLGSDKTGRVQASLGETPDLWGDDLDVDWDGCEDAVSDELLEGWAEALWEALADDAAAVLGPELIAALPAALGLEVALGVATTVAADEIGAGLARISIEAREPAAGGVWRVVNGQLLVPFSVGIDAEAHPCVPEATLPPVVPVPVPDLAPGPRGASLVSGTVVRRGLAALWLSGALCGDHSTAGRTLPSEALSVGWEPLMALPEDTPLELALWPRGLPDVALDAAGDGEVIVSTGLIDVEVFGELGGAKVKLLSLAVDADVEVTLRATAEGLLTATVEDVVLRGEGPRAGLLGAPSPEIAEAIVTPLVVMLLEGRPLLRLPPRGGAAPSRATAVGDYLIIPR